MLNKNILLLTGFLSFGILFADNPVVDGAEVSDVNPDSSVSTTEVVVAEAEVASESSSSDEDVQELGKVSVTGSRIKRTDIEGATPLITITRSDMEAQGFDTVYDAVSNLTQNTGSVNVKTFKLVLTVHYRQLT
tara:strand:- start:673 stop:1074 length:402 start_codon:yes stop_codon:yes gene_type:complete